MRNFEKDREGTSLPVRMIKKEELLECEKIQSVAFVYALDTAELEKKIAEGPDPANPYIGYVNDENVITACMELPAYQARYEGDWVRMVGIGGVASLPEYRFGGAIRQILQTALLKMYDSDAVFSALYPFSHPYYRKFGYEVCQTTTQYELPVQALAKFRYTGKARMLRPGDPIDGLKTVFDAHFLRYNMAIRREERHWKRVLGEDTYKERVYTYLLEGEDGPSAYVVLAAEDAGPFEKAGNVREIGFVRPEGLRDVLGFLYRFAAQYGKLRIPLPDDIPLTSLVDESYDLKVVYSNHQMTRVVNVEKALRLKRHFEGAAYTLCVRDDGIAQNDGVFCVRCTNGEVAVEKKAGVANVDLCVDVRTLAQLLLGFLSVDEAMYKADVQVNSNIETLRGVFTKRGVFLTDHF